MVPMSLMAIFLGRATVAISGQAGRLVSHEHGAISSIVQPHHIAANANTKGFGIDESGDVRSYETVWHFRAALAVLALDHTPTTKTTITRHGFRRVRRGF